MDFINYASTMVILIFIGILYDRYKRKYDLDDEDKQYKLIREYLLQDSSLATTKKPLLWIHVEHNKNARKWLDFYSRSTDDLNQPYQHLSVASIINHCGESFNIVIIDDNTFGKIIPGWVHDMSSIPDPIKSNLRQLALCKALYYYGGLLVPSSFVCGRDLIQLYERNTKSPDIFFGEFINTNITRQYGITDFFPTNKFMGCKRESECMKSLVTYVEGLISRDYTDEHNFEGAIARKCYQYISENKANKICGGLLGVKSKKGKPIVIDELLGNTFVDFVPGCYGLYIPYDDILKRTKYEWFARMDMEQVLRSETVLGKILLTNVMPSDNSANKVPLIL
jgi:hypothetical protein